MSYDSVETGLRDVIVLHDDFTTNNTVKGDYRILGKGLSRAIVLTPGPFTKSVSAAPRRIAWVWTVNMELFIPFRGELSIIANSLRTIRQDVMDQIDQYPLLNSTSGVIDAWVEGGSEPDIWQGENKKRWVQRMRVVIKERTTVTIAE